MQEFVILTAGVFAAKDLGNSLSHEVRTEVIFKLQNYLIAKLPNPYVSS